MKLALFGAVSALTLIAGAAHAQTTVGGYVGAGYDYSNTPSHGTYDYESTETFHDSGHSNSGYIEGAVALPVKGIFGVQADLAYENSSDSSRYTYNTTGGEEETSTSSTSGHADSTVATAHVFARTDMGLVGVFGGEEDLGGVRLLGGGVEGQYYMGRFTFGASVGVATNDYYYTGYNKPVIVSGRLDVHYFPTDDLSISASVGYLHGQDSYTYSDSEHYDLAGPNLFTVGAAAEWKPVWSPVSFLGAAGYARENDRAVYTYSESVDETDTEYRSGAFIKLGIRWSFGGSLFDRDRHGASLNSFQKAFGDEFGVSAPVFEGA